MQSTINAPKLSRRSFIKGAAMFGAAGIIGCQSAAVSVVEAAEAPPECPDTIYAGVCRGNCFSGCFLNVHVRDGQVVRTSARDLPNTEFNRICAKGLTMPLRIYSPARIQYPMKRVGERGSGEWERITWEEAMDTLITKWNEYTAEYGPSAMAMYTGSGSYGLMTGAQTFGCANQRFINASGCSFINFNVDLAALGSSSMISSAAPGTLSATVASKVGDADVLFLWSNPELSQPQVVHFILDAMEKGTKVVVCDPRFTWLAGRAYKYVPVNPGSDGAVGIAMCKTIIENGWQNTEFLKKYSTMPFLVKEDGCYLMNTDVDEAADPENPQPMVIDESGSVVALDQAQSFGFEGSLTTENGIAVKTVYTKFLERLAEYDIDECCRVCGLSKEDIYELADLFANGGKVSYMSSPGLTHYTNGVGAFAQIHTLAILCGQLGESGRGPALGQCQAGIMEMVNTALVADPTAPGGAFGYHQYQSHGLDVTRMDEVMEKNEFQGKEVHLKGMFIATVNPLAAASDLQYMLDWFDKVEFIVTCDTSMTTTARYSDIVLPAASWFEQEDIWNLFGNHPYALFQDKCIEPLYESRTDYSILRELAEGIGCGQYFDMDEVGYMKFAVDTSAVSQMSGISYDTLKENKAMVPLADDQFVYADGCAFGNPYGRVTVFQEALAPKVNSVDPCDIEKYTMIYWEEPTEAGIDNAMKDQFPYVMISNHSRFRTHSQWWDVEMLKEIDNNELHVLLNNEDAAELGVAADDYVRLYNDRGYAVAKACITGGLARGIISVDGCWDESEMVEGAINRLTGRYSDHFIRDTPFYDCRVAIEKA